MKYQVLNEDLSKFTVEADNVEVDLDFVIFTKDHTTASEVPYVIALVPSRFVRQIKMISE